MKVITFVLLAIVSYVLAWDQLASIGITNSAIYIAESRANGHTAGAIAAMLTYLVTPGVLALLVWLGLYGALKLISWPFVWLLQQHKTS